MICISPSILSADFSKLGEQVSLINRSGADSIHIDVMDGRFVPSITIGPLVLSSIRPYSALPMDVHLMVLEPERHIEQFSEAGADSITVHAEGCLHLDRTLRSIRALGKKVGVSLNPATSICVLEYVLPLVDIVLLMTVNPGFGGQKYIGGMTSKIEALKNMIVAGKHSAKIYLDGGINLENIREVSNAGADVAVTGSAFFASADASQFIRLMKETAIRG